MKNKLATWILASLFFALLAVGTQPATWGATAVSCNTSGGWINPMVWGLEAPCYPDAGVCNEPDWSVTIEPACFLTLNASPSLTTLTLNGFVFSDGTSQTVSVSGMTTIGAGRVGGNLIASGPLEISGNGTVDGDLISSSTVIMRDDSSVFLFLGAFQNDGDLRKVGAATTSSIGGVFNSPGTVEVESFGTLSFGGGGVASNLVELHPGAVLEVLGPYEFSGDVVGTGVVRIDAHLDQINSTGTWTAGLDLKEGDIDFASIGTPGSVAMSYGTLTGDLRIEGPLDWTGGTMAAPGTTWITATADVTDDFLDPKLDGRRLEVEPGATLNIWRLPASVAGNGIWGVNGASVHNRGTVNVVEGVPLWAASPADALFENDGLFEKSSPSIATVQFEFFNRGTVNVTDGQLDFSDDYVQIVNPGTLTEPVTQLSGGEIGYTGALVDIRRGFLKGFGAVAPPVQCTGVISPGVESIDLLTFGSTLTLGPGAGLEFELGGTGGGGADHDAIVVSDSLVLDGELLVTFANGFENGVQAGDSFDLISVQSTNAIQGQLAGQPSGSQLLTADGFGSFTVEYGPGATAPHVLLLTNYQSATPNPAGNVPDGDTVAGVPLRVDKAAGTEITLTWGPSCASGDTDYEIYQGEIGDYYSHVKMDPCSTAGAISATFDPPPSVGTYYLVVPTNSTNEGSYGLRSDYTERPQPLHAADRCRPQQVAAVCP